MRLQFASLGVLAGLAVPASAQDVPLFDAPWRSYETGDYGNHTFAMITADLNGDGVADAVTAQNSANPGLRVLLGVAGGPGEMSGFETGGGTRYPLTHGALEVVAADLDGDGDLDLAAPDVHQFYYNGAGIAVFFNDGDGTFGPRQSLPDGGGATGIAAVDFDGDGDTDLATTNYDGANVSILLNNGGGTFAALVPYSTPARPRVVEAGDLDGDGDVDLAVNHDYTQMSVLLNAGNGTFGPAQVYSNLFAGGQPGPTSEVLLLDPDGDGDLDLLHPGSFGDSDVGPSLALLRNNGSAAFTIEQLLYGLPYQNTAHDLTAADLNGDGLDDVVGAQPFEAGYVVFLADGAGGFGPGEMYAAARQSSSHYGAVGVATEDFDGDGDPDVLTAAQRPRLLTVHENVGGGLFPERPIYGRGFVHSVLDLGDVDSDGDLDAVTSHAGAVSADVAVYRNEGGAFTESYRTPGETYGYAKLRDLDGDGVLDLLFVSGPDAPPYDFFTARGLGGGTFGTVVRWPVNSCGGAHPEALDVDADGDLDVINTEDRGCPGIDDDRLFVSRNNGDGTFQPPYVVLVTGFSYNVAGGDFNEDGHLDLVQVGSAPSLVLGNGDGTFGPPQALAFGPYIGANVLALDLNADGHLDLASLGRITTGYHDSFLTVLLGDGAGTFAATEHRDHPTQDFLEWVASGDVEGDGDPDLLMGGVQDAVVFLNDGAGAFTFSGRYGIGAEAHALHYADADGDGHGDLLALAPHDTPYAGTEMGIVVVPGLASIPTDDDPVPPLAPGAALALSAPAPNPATGRVRLALTLAAPQPVRVEAFDALGRRVAVLHEGELAAGPHALGLDASGLAPGVYVVRASGTRGQATRRLVVTR